MIISPSTTMLCLVSFLDVFYKSFFLYTLFHQLLSAFKVHLKILYILDYLGKNDLFILDNSIFDNFLNILSSHYILTGNIQNFCLHKQLYQCIYFFFFCNPQLGCKHFPSVDMQRPPLTAQNIYYNLNH